MNPKKTVYHSIPQFRTEIVESRRTKCGDWWNYRSVHSPFGRLYYVRSGYGTVAIDKIEYQLTPGSVTVIPAHTLSDYFCDAYMDLFWIHFNAVFVDGLDLFEHTGCPYQIVSRSGSNVYGLFHKVIKLHSRSFQGKDIIADALLRQIIGLFVAAADPQKLIERSSAVARFIPVLEYMRRYAENRIDIGTLAGLVFLQPNYFSNLFTRSLGISPVRYLLRIRIEKARHQLWNTGDTLEHIARNTGFSDAFHLSKTFRKVTGISPREFRRQKKLSLYDPQ